MDDHSLRSYQGGNTAEKATAGLLDPVGERSLLYGNLEIRPDEVQALADGRRVGLTVREFQVLLILAEHEDRVLRRADIYSQVWGGEMKYRDRSVDVFVRKLRNKLARAAPGWAYIHTHFGIGYRFASVPLSDERSSHDEHAPHDERSSRRAAVTPEPAGP